MNHTFSKTNYLLLLAGVLIVIAGFALMTGPSTTEQTFEPDIFGTRRTVVAPLVCLFGFLFVIIAILWHRKPSDLPTTKQ